MKNHRSMQSIVAILSCVVIVFFVLLLCARTVAFSKELIVQKQRIRSVEAIEMAGQELTKYFTEDLTKSVSNAYYETLRSIGDESDSQNEKEAEALFLRICLQDINKKYDRHWGIAYDSIQKELSAVSDGKLKLTTESKPKLREVFDHSGQSMRELELTGLTVVYRQGSEFEKSKSYDFRLRIPKAHFFDGNDELFSYSLVGGKGIYITGMTSSIVGNIYAGVHPVAENRKAEAAYGEKSRYGGLNILSTQLGVEADRIISEGDINLKGAFVLFGTKATNASIYGYELHEMAGYPLKTTINIVGETYLGEENMENDETVFSQKALMEEAFSGFSNLEFYYDSSNDPDYRGTYRKIVAGTDVTISGDFTGIVITSGNVIIEADSNIEGTILARDRIYIQGNNSIAANREMLRTLVGEEHFMPKEQIDDGEMIPYKEVSHCITDYIGGIYYKGIKDDRFIYVEML